MSELVGFLIHCMACSGRFTVVPSTLDLAKPGILECPHCHDKAPVIVK